MAKTTVHPIERLLPYCDVLIPYLLEPEELLLTSMDNLQLMDMKIPKEYFGIIQSLLEITQPLPINPGGELDQIYSAITNKEYGLLIQLISNLDILFATLVVRILHASGLLFGIDKINDINIIDSFRFQCIQSLILSCHPSAWPWAFTISTALSSENALRDPLITLFKDFLRKLVSSNTSFYIPILLPLVVSVDHFLSANLSTILLDADELHTNGTAILCTWKMIFGLQNSHELQDELVLRISRNPRKLLLTAKFDDVLDENLPVFSFFKSYQSSLIALDSYSTDLHLDHVNLIKSTISQLFTIKVIKGDSISVLTVIKELLSPLYTDRGWNSTEYKAVLSPLFKDLLILFEEALFNNSVADPSFINQTRFMLLLLNSNPIEAFNPISKH